NVKALTEPIDEDQGVEAIILQASSRNAENYQFIQDYNIPLLLVDRQTEPVIWPLVTTNNQETVEEILHQALQKDYQKVLVVSEPLQDVTTREVRYHTVENMAEKMGKKHELLEVNAKTNLKQLIFGELKNPERTLLFASNGRVLMELLTILIENKIDIPQQIGITGFDDWHLTALVGPGITSIEQQSQQIGEVAAEKLMNFLKNAEELEQEIIVPAKVQWRKSI
ncbi:MAG TPA: substrate-binding domain-containing protein, partial [Enterococcus sp.]|nr:substrate-binding domain-containing protein [Enterococcus sp.]